MGQPYYISSGMNCYRASQARSRLNNSLTIGNNGPRRASCPKKARPVAVNAKVTNALHKASKSGRGIVEGELKAAIRCAGPITDANLPNVKASLQNAIKNLKFGSDKVKDLAYRMTKASSAEELTQIMNSPRIERAVNQAAKSGQGITKKEIAGIVKDAYGSEAKMPTPYRTAIGTSINAGMFARESTYQLAKQVVTGHLSAAQAGRLLGFSLANNRA